MFCWTSHQALMLDAPCKEMIRTNCTGTPTYSWLKGFIWTGLSYRWLSHFLKRSCRLKKGQSLRSAGWNPNERSRPPTFITSLTFLSAFNAKATLDFLHRWRDDFLFLFNLWYLAQVILHVFRQYVCCYNAGLKPFFLVGKKIFLKSQTQTITVSDGNRQKRHALYWHFFWHCHRKLKWWQRMNARC